MKEDEKKTIPWEAADPKPPMIQSGHMENHIRREMPADFEDGAPMRF